MTSVSSKNLIGSFIIDKYSNGQLAVFLRSHNGEPIAELSIMNDSLDLDSDEFILKTYSENALLTSSIFNSNLFVPTNRFVLIGAHFCPVFRIASNV